MIPDNFYLLALSALAVSALFSRIAAKAATRLGVVDRPDQARKRHREAIPLLGGTAVFACFFAFIFLNIGFLTSGNLELRHWLGFFAGAAIIMAGGFLDDKYGLKPKEQVIFPVLASLAAIGGGISIERISHPLGGFLWLDGLTVELCACLGNAGRFSLISSVLVLVWLMGMMYTTKVLDGLDGLVGGVTAIGALVIALFTFTTRYFQPDIGLAAYILFFSILGFMLFNWHPARLFLGEGGSLFLGYALGVLSIISGAKIAIALLVMGLPILDLAWTIIQRLRQGQNPFRHADRRHLHFRLLDIGLSQRQAALFYYFFALSFGLSALFLQSRGKLFALMALVALMALLVVVINRIHDKKRSRQA